MWFKSLLNTIIRKLGKANYKIDNALEISDLLIIMFEKGTSALRGFYYKLWIKKSDGILFIGKHCKLKHCNKIIFGKVVTIDDMVEINALSKNGVTFGNNVTIRRNTVIDCTGVIRELGEGLTIGNNVGISQNCFIQVRGCVTIGSNVMFGPNVSIFSENHGFNRTDIPMIAQDSMRQGITIEDDVWIGAGATILDGVTLGKGSIVAAGALVNTNVPNYGIAAGVPAKIIKNRMD